MDEWAAFLKARLDEDEAAANAGARRAGMPWRVDPEPWGGDTGIIDDLGRVGSTGGRYAAEHIVRHDPARVLREVAALRKILAEIESELADDATQQMTRDRLRALAGIWDGHPDYPGAKKSARSS